MKSNEQSATIELMNKDITKRSSREETEVQVDT